METNSPSLHQTQGGSLDRVTEAGIAKVNDWHRILAQGGVTPNEAQCCERAATVAIDRAAAHIIADPPHWITDMLGTRPTAAEPAHVWDATVREVAALQQRHDSTLPETLPSAGHDAESLLDLMTRTRLWLDHRATTVDQIDVGRSDPELSTRRAELDALLESAPPDQRHLIAQLRSGDQLPFDNTADVLRQALQGDAARREWILTNWPHIVERAELDRTTAALDHAGDEALGVSI